MDLFFDFIAELGVGVLVFWCHCDVEGWIECIDAEGEIVLDTVVLLTDLVARGQEPRFYILSSLRNCT